MAVSRYLRRLKGEIFKGTLKLVIALSFMSFYLILVLQKTAFLFRNYISFKEECTNIYVLILSESMAKGDFIYYVCSSCIGMSYSQIIQILARPGSSNQASTDFWVCLQLCS